MFSAVIVGEAWGQQEAIAKKPFIGKEGQELSRMLRDAGIIRSDCHITDVFNERLPGNNLKHFLFQSTIKNLPPDYDAGQYPPIESSGWYVKPEYIHHVDRCREEVREIKPNLLITLGNPALWCFTRAFGIGKVRGTIQESPVLPGQKMLPTYHPSLVLRQWSYRPTVLMDLLKARNEADFPDIRRVRREIWIHPTLEDLLEFERLYIKPDSILSFDIETAPSKSILKCIGIAPDPTHCLVLPFQNQNRREDYSYWRTVGEEVEAWLWLRRLLEGPHEKLGQNGGGYDIPWLVEHGIRVRNYRRDTMLIHHALQPELPKDLGFLGSVYCNEAAWKTTRPRGSDKAKREDG